MKDIFTEFAKVRDKIHSLCISSKCPSANKCTTRKTICFAETRENKRYLVRTSGGNFTRYIALRNKIVQDNMALVVNQARKMGCMQDTFNDLLQEGYIGLIKSIEMFDPTISKFSTYSYGRIRKMMLKYIKDNNLVRRKGQSRELIKYIHIGFDMAVQRNPGTMITTEMVIEQIGNYRQNHGYTSITMSKPAIREMVDSLNMSQNRPTPVRKLGIRTTEQEHSDSLYHLLSRELDEDLLELSASRAEIIRMRFGIGEHDRPMGRIEIGSSLGVTRQFVDKVVGEFFDRKPITELI